MGWRVSAVRNGAEMVKGGDTHLGLAPVAN